MATREPGGLGTILKTFRSAAGLTQEELAERAGVSVRSISDLERGLNQSPRPGTMRRLADALELSPAQRTRLLGTEAQGRAGLEHPKSAMLGGLQKTMRERLRRPVVAIAAVCALAVAAGAIVLIHPRGGSSAGDVRVYSTARASVVLDRWGAPSGRPVTRDGVIAAALPAPNGTGYALAFGATVTVLRFSATGQQLSSWTIPGTKPSDLIRIGDGKVDARGNLWVTTDQNDVREYSPDGQLLAHWGGAGFSPNPGQFWYPLGLGLASNGEVVVGDAGSHRIQVLTPAGKSIGQWSGPGRSPERLQNFVPRAIAMDRQDDVYVLDTGNFGVGNYQVEKYSLQGKLLAVFHPPGLRYYSSGNCGPDLTTDSQGDVYVLDCGANKKSIRIDRFDERGRKLAPWTSLRSQPRVSGEITIMRFNGQANGYASVLGRPAVLKINEVGHVLAAWTAEHLWRPLFESPRAVAADQAGNVFVSDSGRVVRVSSDAVSVRGWRSDGVGISPSATSDIAIDRHGHVVALDARTDRVVTYSASGRLVGTWGRSGGPGDLVQPISVGVDGQGNIDVLDVGDNRVKTFSPSGGLIDSWSLDPYMQTGSIPSSMAVDSQGDIYLGIDNRILKLSPDGLPVRAWGSVGTGPGRFLNIGGIAVDRKGNVFATDAGQNRLQVFSASGKLLASWLESGPKDPRFAGLGALAVDDHDDIFVLNGAQLIELAPLMSL